MNTRSYHVPVSTRQRCPVCHQSVYSRAGIHPQCAIKLSELPPSPKAKPPGSTGTADGPAKAPEPAEATAVATPSDAES